MKAAIICVAIIIMLGFYLIFGHNGILKYNEMVEIQSRYQRQIESMDEKIIFLEREISLLQKDNEYLEYVIRRELGVQKADEDQYIIKR